jgi:hypothetical protein
LLRHAGLLLISLYNSIMESFVRIMRSLFICINVVCFAWVGLQASIKTDMHIASSHQVPIDHHHHNLFEAHPDHEAGSAAHAHAADSVQTNALVPDKGQWVYAAAAITPLGLHPHLPPDVFLEGLLRPPQNTL